MKAWIFLAAALFLAIIMPDGTKGQGTQETRATFFVGAIILIALCAASIEEEKKK